MRRRGGALIYLILVVSAVTILVVATSTLVPQVRQQNVRDLNELRALTTFESALDYLTSLDKADTLTLNSPYPINLNRMTGTITATDNSTNLAGSYLVSCTLQFRGKTYKFTRVVGDRKSRHPFDFALFADQNLDMMSNIQTGQGGPVSSVYADGNIDLSTAGVSITGTLEASGTCVANAVASNRFEIISGSDPITMTVPNSIFYLAVSSNTELGNRDINSLTFGAEAGGYYPLHYVGGNLKLKGGTFRNKGVIFVNGNCEVEDDIFYGGVNDSLVVVCKGELRIKNKVATLNGFFYAAGNLRVDSPSLNVPRGAIAAKSIESLTSLSIDQDRSFVNSRAEARKFRVPGVWP
jgi:hypothetical protein